MEPGENKDVEMAVEGEQPKAETETPVETTEAAEVPQPIGRPISDLVNQEFAKTIQEMGFTKAVAEKSLLFTNNASVEAAMDWITQHQDDDDFLNEEFLAEEPGPDPNKPKLSKEERIKAAEDLQKRIRAKREAEEKKEAEEREKNRIRSTKELQKAKRIMEDNQKKLKLELEKKEKLEFIAEKKRMEEILRKVFSLKNLTFYRKHEKEQERNMYQEKLLL